MHVIPRHDKWEEWNQGAGEQQHGDRFPLMRLVRYETSAPLRLEEVQEGQEDTAARQEGAGITVNVSSGGLCLMMDWAPAVKEVLRLHVPMPVPLAEIPTLAEVRWVRTLPFGWEGVYAVGLQFML